VKFRVNGIPAPQGSKRHVGGGIMIESSKAVKPWREAVRTETQRALENGSEPFAKGQPVMVWLNFWLPRPKGHYGTGRNAAVIKPSAPQIPVVQPDLDKLQRAVLDGLKSGGAYADDCQVACIVAGKEYADHCAPGCDIRVEHCPVRQP